MSFLKSLFKLWSVSSYVPVICECTAPLLPKVRQEAMQNQRHKDRKGEGKSCGQCLGETGNLFQDFVGFTTGIVVWAEKQGFPLFQ